MKNLRAEIPRMIQYLVSLLMFAELTTVDAICGTTTFTDRFGVRSYETLWRETCVWNFVPPNNRTDMILTITIIQLQSTKSIYNVSGGRVTLPDGSKPPAPISSTSWCATFVANVSNGCKANYTKADICPKATALSTTWPPQLTTNFRKFRIYFMYSFFSCPGEVNINPQPPASESTTASTNLGLAGSSPSVKVGATITNNAAVRSTTAMSAGPLPNPDGVHNGSAEGTSPLLFAAIVLGCLLALVCVAWIVTVYKLRRNKKTDISPAAAEQNPYEEAERNGAMHYNTSSSSGSAPYAVYTLPDQNVPYAMAGGERPSELTELTASSPLSPVFPINQSAASNVNVGFTTDDSYLVPDQRTPYALAGDETASPTEITTEVVDNQLYNPYEEC